MRRSPRILRIAFNHRALTHYRGAFFFHGMIELLHRPGIHTPARAFGLCACLAKRVSDNKYLMMTKPEFRRLLQLRSQKNRVSGHV